MTQPAPGANRKQLTMKRSAVLMTMLAACIPLTGCVMVGYSSRGGFFVWPGSFAFLLIGLLLWLLFRGR